MSYPFKAVPLRPIAALLAFRFSNKSTVILKSSTMVTHAPIAANIMPLDYKRYAAAKIWEFCKIICAPINEIFQAQYRYCLDNFIVEAIQQLQILCTCRE